MACWCQRNKPAGRGLHFALHRALCAAGTPRKEAYADLTLAVSVLAHAAVVAAILVVPIFATADLPDPRRPLTFEAITPIVTPTVPVTPRSQTVQPSAKGHTGHSQ